MPVSHAPRSDVAVAAGPLAPPTTNPVRTTPAVTDSDDLLEGSHFGLLEVLALLDDPRHRRGRRHQLVSILAIAVVAVLAGAHNLLAIAERATDLSQDQLRRLGAWQHPDHGLFCPPSYATLSRVLHTVGAADLDRLIGGWLLGQARPMLSTGTVAGVALDGKVVRGPVTNTGGRVCLFSAVLHQPGVGIAQVAVPTGTTETTQVPALLGSVEVAGMTVTADAAHTTAATATYLVTEKHAAYLLPVKANRPGLLAAVAQSLAGRSDQWQEYVTDQGNRGRLERRTLRVAPVDPATDGIDFPHAAQVYRLRRDVLGADRVGRSKQVVFGITSLTGEQAGPAEVARLIRGQWSIECVHWLRDTVYREDGSRLTGSAAQVMATLRNLSIGMIRLSGETKITSATRSMGHNINRALALVGLRPAETPQIRLGCGSSGVRVVRG